MSKFNSGIVLSLHAGAVVQAPPKDATEATKNANAAVLNELPFADKQDFEDANRGFIATVPELGEGRKGERRMEITAEFSRRG